MTTEAQRIAIAEACGWRPSTTSRRCCFDPTGLSTYWDNAPDYPADLNAMHEAEESPALDGKWNQYEKELARLTIMGRCIWHSTAAQRAEAFLRTLSLWKDEP